MLTDLGIIMRKGQTAQGEGSSDYFILRMSVQPMVILSKGHMVQVERGVTLSPYALTCLPTLPSILTQPLKNICPPASIWSLKLLSQQEAASVPCSVVCASLAG